MATKYVHTRMPGRSLIHLVPPENLKLDLRFGEESQFVHGAGTTLCGKTNSGWIVGMGGEHCPTCFSRR